MSVILIAVRSNTMYREAGHRNSFLYLILTSAVRNASMDRKYNKKTNQEWRKISTWWWVRTRLFVRFG